MKKKKPFTPLPEGCEAFRASWMLGLTVTFGEIALIFLGIFIPVSICAALKEHDPSFCAFILLVAVLLLMAYGTCAALVLLFSHTLGKPRVGILDGQIYLTDRKRSIPIERIVSMDLYLGYQGRSMSQPPRLTISLPYDDTFEITRPSIRFLRILRGSLPQVRFTVDWKHRIWWSGGIGLVGGMILGIVILCL